MFMTLPVVIRIEPCELAESSITLYKNKVLVIIHIKRSLVRVLHLPNQDKSDLDRVSVLVIYLDGLTVKVSGSQ